MTAAVSVIMINHNGGAALRRALESCRADLEATWAVDPSFELLVVDNRSTDDSLQTIARELGGAPFPWRVIVEPEAGVNFARNAGVRAARGDLLIFADSDLSFHRGWLKAYIDAAAENPEVGVFGGRVHVGAVEGRVPPWLDLTGPYSRNSIVVQLDCGDSSRVLAISDRCGPVGPNMALRRRLFEDSGLFDTRFGLRPGSLVAGAEAEFFDRLSHAGRTFVYVAGAAVDHPVRRAQLSKRYFLRRLHGVGRVLARIRRLRGARSKRAFGMTLYVFPSLLMTMTQYAGRLVRRGPRERFFYRGQLSIYFGHLHEDLSDWTRQWL